MQLSWSELNKKMMEPVEPRHSRQAVEQQMVAISNAADWEVDLAPGLLLQVVDLTPYVNTSALKVRMQGDSWGQHLRTTHSTHALVGRQHIFVYTFWGSRYADTAQTDRLSY